MKNNSGVFIEIINKENIMADDIKDIHLAPQGKKRIEWADRDMPVLRNIRSRFEKEKPLEGLTIGACLHVTTETALLLRTLKAGGARVILCASNPLSTQDDTAAALVKEYGISVFAVRGEDRQLYYQHINAVLDAHPQITLDDGADLVSLIHKERESQAEEIFGSMEETTTGIIRLRSLEREGRLKIPIIAVNDAPTKNLFDNRYGTGQSAIDGILRATNVLLAGKVFVVAGYGWCGKGLSQRARGLGARVIVTEVNPLRALEAVMDGFSVMPMLEAVRHADIICTVTGNRDVLRKEHFHAMKDGAILCNAGHFDVEIHISDLTEISREINRNVIPYVDEYILSNGRRIFLLAQGRLVNLSAASGHPASVMDMSFATQALAVEYVASQKEKLEKKVHVVPSFIIDQIAKLKLTAMNISIDTLTPEQEAYLSSWSQGT